MIRYSDFYRGESIEELLMEASSINLRNEVIELALQLREEDNSLSQFLSLQKAFITLKEHYEAGN